MRTNFNSNSLYQSPFIQEYERVEKLVEGVATVTYEPVVYPEFPDSRDYSLESMLKAGIDPAGISINVGANSRLDSMDEFVSISAQADSILNSNE